MSDLISQKPIEDCFTDWEAATFGFGYGSGEPHILAALKRFFELCPESTADRRSYDFSDLEAALTPTVAWLLINVLGHADMIEYGTSPRFAWLTDKGYALKAFMEKRPLNDLLALTSRDQDYIHCSPDYCNCDPQGYVEGRKCHNPFWWSPSP